MGCIRGKMIIILLVITLIISVYIHRDIKQIQDAISLVSNIDKYYELSSQINTLDNELESLADSLKWVVYEEFVPNIEKSKIGDINLDILFELKDHEKGRNVYIEYSKDQINWNRVEAAKGSDFNYVATLNLHPSNEYIYRTVAIGSVNRYSDVKTIPESFYKPKSPYISFSSKGETGGFGINNYEIVLRQDESIFDFFKVSVAHMEIEYFDGNVESIEFIDGRITNLEDHHYAGVGKDEILLYAKKDFHKEVKNIALRVSYKDGTKTEGNIWPWNTYHNAR